MEKIPNKEKISSAREKLLSLEKEGKFVFHGSAREIETLEPRQPYIERSEKYGNPCVATTPFADIAIFRAIVNEDNFPQKGYSSIFGFDSDKGVELYASQTVLNNIDNKKGFVYVLDKSLFEKFSVMEWRSGELVEPIKIIEVTTEDLPPNIKLMDKNFKIVKK